MYTGGSRQFTVEFSVGGEAVMLRVSVFVLGFAIGPLIWAPMSELLGPQVIFIAMYCALTVFNPGAAGSLNIQLLIILQFFAGFLGLSPLTNAGAVSADMFSVSHQGLGMSILQYVGGVLGPITERSLGITEGW